MTAHNHGPAEGPGLDCNESTVNGRRVGRCIGKTEPTAHPDREWAAEAIATAYEAHNVTVCDCTEDEPCQNAYDEADALLASDGWRTHVTEPLAKADQRETDALTERDRLHDVADEITYSLATVQEVGEHSSMNNPWDNVVDHVHGLTQRLQAERDAARAELADLRAGVEALAERWMKFADEGASYPWAQRALDLRAALDATPAPDALARVRAEALREAGFASFMGWVPVFYEGESDDWMNSKVRAWLNDRADRVERGDL